jgi:UMF1 family MFS transporter
MVHTERAGFKEIVGWSFYDFATTAFSTTILTVIFNRYFAEVVAGGEQGVLVLGRHIDGASLFGYVLALASALVALASPILGALADFSGQKKRFMFVLCYISVIFTGLLYFVGEGHYWLGSALFIVAYVGYFGSLTFYNAFLPEISTERTIGRVSGWGSALGWLGGGLLLVINLLMLLQWGLHERDTFVSVALWMALFTVPTLLWLREGRAKKPLPAGSTYLQAGFRQVLQTLRRVKEYGELSKYFVANLIYNDGMTTVISFATIFASRVLGMSEDESILLILMSQGTGMFGALLFGYLGDRLGQKRAILITLAGWCLIVIWAYELGLFGSAKTEFWMLAFLAGLMLGGNFVVSRSLLGLFTPEAHRAEFFGFFSLAGRLASLLGPLVYGLFIDLTGSMQTGILSLIAFFIVGTLLLLLVDERRALEEKRVA